MTDDPTVSVFTAYFDALNGAVELTMEEWEEQFGPFMPDEQISDPGEVPPDTPVAQVWTYVDEGKDTLILSGVHRVNLWGWQISAKPVPQGKQYVVVLPRDGCEDDEEDDF